jgi:WhiB family redox-sensing transcriptional regulator
MTDRLIDWREHAACRQANPSTFFPYKEGVTRIMRKALTYCDVCPVRMPCLEEALLDPTLSGVWAGTTTEERDVLRRKAMIGLPRKNIRNLANHVANAPAPDTVPPGAHRQTEQDQS